MQRRHLEFSASLYRQRDLIKRFFNFKLRRHRPMRRGCCQLPHRHQAHLGPHFAQRV